MHHGNGIADIFANEPRIRYCSTHEAGGFPGTGMDPEERGLLGNMLQLPLPKGSGSEVYLRAIREHALPFLLQPFGHSHAWPSVLLVCAGYDALEADPLATMRLQPSDYYESVQIILNEFGFPAERIALGLEGGYDLCHKSGMPAGVVQTCAAFVSS